VCYQEIKIRPRRPRNHSKAVLDFHFLKDDFEQFPKQDQRFSSESNRHLRFPADANVSACWLDTDNGHGQHQRPGA
jgi:hypothetical protein